MIFSLDTESGFRDVVFITGAYGLGENVVQGAVDPDEFYVHKPTFSSRPSRRAAPPARRQGREDDLRRGRDEEHDAKRPDPEGRPRALLPQRRRRAGARRLRDARSRTHYGAADGHRVGEGRRSTGSSTSSRRGPRRSPPSAARPRSRPTCSRARARSSPRAARSARGSPRARCRRDREPHAARASSSPARCWSPTPPRPTGSR